MSLSSIMEHLRCLCSGCTGMTCGPVLTSHLCQTRFGRAGQGYPDFAVPTVVAEAVPNRTFVGDAYIGATKRQAQLTSTRFPVRRGNQNSFDNVMSDGACCRCCDRLGFHGENLAIRARRKTRDANISDSCCCAARLAAAGPKRSRNFSRSDVRVT